MSTCRRRWLLAEVELERPDKADEIEHDRPWVVIVWNDPINLMSYVTLVV
jgi:ATP-dependent Clp protease adaptor protein ClpS